MNATFIDLTPTWREVLPALTYAAVNADTPQARAAAMDELLRLADFADAINTNAKT